MNILVLGNSNDSHAAHIYNALVQVGIDVNYLDTNLFPQKVQISWNPLTQKGNIVLSEGKKLALEKIHSVFWRQIHGVGIPTLNDTSLHQIAFNDSMSALRTFIQACPARWVNSWQAYQFHKDKPLQLGKAKEIGVTIPETLISNNPEEIREFAKCREKLIYKPVSGGAYTELVTQEHLHPERLQITSKISPVTLQEYIPGTNIRSYVIKDEVYSAEIRTQYLDFREDIEAKLIPINLPESVRRQCLAITQAFKLEWTAIDWRLKPTGEYVFLEANPSPMFLHFENQTKYPITKKLVELLIS